MILTSLLALAATSAPPSSDEIVVTAARIAQSAREVGQAVTVIDRAEIERRQTVVVSDLLATTPGVTVSRSGGLGTLTGVRIRGAEADQTLVVIDGVRVNDPSSTGGGFDFAHLLAGSIDRIEVLRGPNSVPWGSQAIGGVVNIVTATPTEGLSGRGSVEYGDADSVFANAGVSGAKGAFSGALTGGYLRSDGISAVANGSERDGYRQYGGTGKASVTLAPGIGVDVAGYFAHSRAQLDGSPPPTYALADDAEYSRTQEAYGYVGLHADLAGGRLRNRIAFTIADIDRDNYDADIGPVPIFFGRGRSERYEYQGDFKLADAARIVAGAEHEDSRFNDGSTFAATGITSFWGEAIVRPFTALTLTGGVRHDRHEDFGNHTTFGADAALVLAGGTTIRASYGEGFKAPTLFQLFSFYGTPTLQPETAHNVDLGIEQSLADGRVVLSATAFRRRTRNQIDFDLGTSTYANIARARAKGVELAAAARPVDGLMISANYSFIDSENRSPGANFGNRLARRPRQTLALVADCVLPFGLSVGGTLRHVGDSFDDAGNTVRLDGYVLGDLRAAYPINAALEVYGRIENVGDAHYQTVAGYGTIGRAAYGGVRARF